jgi:penicillin-binding protein 1A
MPASKKLFSRIIASFVGLALTGVITIAALIMYLLPELPSTDNIMDIPLSVPMRVYTADNALVAEFGEKRRQPVSVSDVPPQLINAILSTEDANFYHHGGVDFVGILRAVVANLSTGGHGQGASTITMQVARNYFLTPEKTYKRKLKEVLLSFKLESQLTKDQILELYINKIFLGHRAYGFGAAAEVYYGKPLADLELAQLAMLAGLPKAPSRDNPISNPERAQSRRNHVLNRMLQLEHITPEQYQLALAAPVSATRHGSAPDLQAPYIAEMVRDFMFERYGEAAYTSGYRVYTTVSAKFQQAADEALFNGLVLYDERHGFRGRIGTVDIANPDLEDNLAEAFKAFPTVGKLIPAIILDTQENEITALLRDGQKVTIDKENFKWARKYLDTDHRGPQIKHASDIAAAGDVVYLRRNEDETWRLSQLPGVEGALVSLNPENGAILALSGGFNFYASKFNRVTQARRQPGSNIKPFIYSAALENGFTSASLISGAPVVIRDSNLGSSWRPENYSKKFFGKIRMREALTRSLNLVSVRLLRAIGIGETRDYMEKFGFARENLPDNLTLALGSASVLPMEVARGYSVFANGGFLIEPYLVQRIESGYGEIEYEAEPLTPCRLCPSPSLLDDESISDPADGTVPEPVVAAALDAEENAVEPVVDEPAAPDHAPWATSRENAFIVSSMLQSVIQSGTGRRARSLGRPDIAGKTGTTNEQRDAWFSGFGPGVETTVWVGFDQPAPLGRNEVGGRAALPVWIDYMSVALADTPVRLPDIPAGIEPAYISKKTGRAAAQSDAGAILEYFIAGTEPGSAEPTYADPFAAPDAGEDSLLPEDIM